MNPGTLAQICDYVERRECYSNVIARWLEITLQLLLPMRSLAELGPVDVSAYDRLDGYAQYFALFGGECGKVVEGAAEYVPPRGTRESREYQRQKESA